MNVLFTAAGRRNYLLEYFREAIPEGGAILAADSSPDAPALAEADETFVLPLFDDDRYVESVLRICRDRHVDLLVPLNDFELPLYAAVRREFLASGVFPLVSSTRVVATCLDKLATYRFLRRQEVATPETYNSLRDTRAALLRGSLTYPLVLKPRWGSGSQGVYVAHDDLELRLLQDVAVRAALRLVPRRHRLGRPDNALLVQQHVDGDEVGIDVVNDLNGRFAGVLARRKLGMRSGETDRAVTSADDQWLDLGKRLSRSLRHIGDLDCDVMVKAGRPYLLDMNPRFGGGYPFNHAAGARVPAAIVAWLKDEHHDPAWLRAEPDVVVAKCDRLVRTAAADVGAGHVANPPPERVPPSRTRPPTERGPVAPVPGRGRVTEAAGPTGNRTGTNRLATADTVAAARFHRGTGGL